MRSENLRSAILATLASVAPEADLHGIRHDQPLRAQIELDSMDWLNVVADLSERLSIEIPEADYGRLATIDSIVAYASARRARPAGEPAAPEAAGRGLPCTQHLINDTRVAVRPIRPEDLELEVDFVRNLAMESRYNRFMVAVSELPQAKLKYLTDVDQVRHVALVATAERAGRQALLGVVRFVIDPAGTGCEFAIAIDDAWHGTGLAGVLMHALMRVARARGLATMEGSVLAANTRMLKFMRQLGFRQERDPDDRSTVRVVRTL